MNDEYMAVPVACSHSIKGHGLALHPNIAAVDAFQPLFSSHCEDTTTTRAPAGPVDGVG